MDVAISNLECVLVSILLTFHRKLESVNPRPLLCPLVNHAGHLPAIVCRGGDQPVFAAHRDGAIWPVRGGGRVIPSDRRQPLDGGCRLGVR